MKRLFVLMLLALIMPAIVVSASGNIISDLSLQGMAGSQVSGIVVNNLKYIDSKDIFVELTVGRLATANSEIPSSKIMVTPSGDNFQVRVELPVGQPAGTYTGDLYLTSGQTLLDQSKITLTVSNNVSPGISFTIADLDLGSNSQRRDTDTTANLKITNTGSQAVTLALNSNAASKYSLVFGQNNINVASGQSVDVPVTIIVPQDQDSGKVQIATITATAQNGASVASKVYLTTKSELTISKVKAVIDGKSSTLDDKEDVDAEPNDDVTLTITIKNDFDDSVEIEDIEVTVESDSDLDWDDEADVTDLDDGDKDDVEFSFDIPGDIDEDEYDVEISVDGEDENGARHSADYTITINIEKEKHEISIVKASINPSKLDCDGGKATISVTLENTGANDEDKAAIELISEELDIEVSDSRFSLDEGDDIVKTFVVNIPADMDPGEYIVDIRAYTDATDFSDQYALPVKIEKCISTTNPPLGNGGTGNTGGNTNVPPVVVPTGSVGPVYGTTSFFNSPAYIILLVAALLIFIVLILVLLLKFVF